MQNYIVGYVAGFGNHGWHYYKIVSANSAGEAAAQVVAEKTAAPFMFDWVEVGSSELSVGE